MLISFSSSGQVPDPSSCSVALKVCSGLELFQCLEPPNHWLMKLHFSVFLHWNIGMTKRGAKKERNWGKIGPFLGAVFFENNSIKSKFRSEGAALFLASPEFCMLLPGNRRLYFGFRKYWTKSFHINRDDEGVEVHIRTWVQYLSWEICGWGWELEEPFLHP